MKKFLFLSLLVTVYAIFSVAIWHITEGFSVAKISSDLPSIPKWEVERPPKEEILLLLNQNFYYLGKGSQCYVFESEDKQFVLKFFRHSRYRLPKISQLITEPPFLMEIQNQKKEGKQKKLEDLFQSCKLAFQELRKESGLIYLHLNKTDDLKQTVLLYDKLKRCHPVYIDDFSFVIQVHAEHILPYLTRLLKKGKKQEAQVALQNMVLLHATRLHKGLNNTDVVLHKNSGFYGSKPIFLDIGEFSKGESCGINQELWEITEYLRLWLYRQDQELGASFENFISTL